MTSCTANNDNDTFIAGAGADFFEGGNGVANDGSAGEADDLRLDVENVIGGTQGDTITARAFQANPNRLVGGPGIDVLDSRDAPFLMGDTVDGDFNVAICLTDQDDTRINCF